MGPDRKRMPRTWRQVQGEHRPEATRKDFGPDVVKSSGVYLDGWMSMGVRSGFCGEVSTEVIQGQTESQLACHQRPQREQLVSTDLLRAMDGMAVLSYTERVTAVNPA